MDKYQAISTVFYSNTHALCVQELYQSRMEQRASWVQWKWPPIASWALHMICVWHLDQSTSESIHHWQLLFYTSKRSYRSECHSKVPPNFYVFLYSRNHLFVMRFCVRCAVCLVGWLGFSCSCSHFCTFDILIESWMENATFVIIYLEADWMG